MVAAVYGRGMQVPGVGRWRRSGTRLSDDVPRRREGGIRGNMLLLLLLLLQMSCESQCVLLNGRAEGGRGR